MKKYFVLYDGKMFYCPKCKVYFGQTIFKRKKYCYNCALPLDWNVWDKDKNNLKREYVVKKEKHVFYPEKVGK